MQADVILDILNQTLFVIMFAVGVIITPGLIVGLIIAMFQAATSINEMTLSFLPKLFVIVATIAFLSHWLINLLIGYVSSLINDIPYIIG